MRAPRVPRQGRPVQHLPAPPSPSGTGGAKKARAARGGHLLPAPACSPHAGNEGGAPECCRTYIMAGGATSERSADCGSEGDRPLGARLRNLGDARSPLADLSKRRLRWPRLLPGAGGACKPLAPPEPRVHTGEGAVLSAHLAAAFFPRRALF